MSLEPPTIGQYPMAIAWSQEDQSYVALVPDLPGCCACGSTLEETIYEVKGAMEAWLEACDELGRARPSPTPFERFNTHVKAVRQPDQYEVSVSRERELPTTAVGI